MPSTPVAADPVRTETETDHQQAALQVKNLTIGLIRGGSSVPLVTDLDLSVARRQILGLVGESGSGKSLTSLAIAGLLNERTLRVTDGSIKFFGRELLGLRESQLRDVRGKDIAMIFQDPMTSLDPAFTTGYQITSVLRSHIDMSRKAAKERAVELLALVGIGAPRRRADQYPHQMSGGMRQRVMIAIAIACEPRLLIADEPTTALDSTTQAQILELIKDLTAELHMSTIITTHDLGVVAEVCDTVAVMYAGQVVERAETEQLFYRPQHPYTQRLLMSLPRLGVGQDMEGIPGVPPRSGRFPTGCRFAPRCEYATEPQCTEGPIPLLDLEQGRRSRCIRVPELNLSGVAK